MKAKLGKILLVLMIISCAAGAILGLRHKSTMVRADSAVSDIEKDDEAVQDADGEENQGINRHRMVANLASSGICGDKTDAVCMVAEMLLAEGKEAEFVAGVCGNILCEGRNGMFERDWGGNLQDYLPSRKWDDPYKYSSTYANKYIYNGFSLSKVYKMAKDLYYNYDWDRGRYMFGLGCVQWTQKRTVQLIEYYIAEAGDSDTITKEQCVAAEMKFIKYELNNTETGAYEHWSAGDHKKKYPNDAARAGYCVARYYERCSSSYYTTRAETAAAVYEAMMGRKPHAYADSLETSVEK